MATFNQVTRSQRDRMELVNRQKFIGRNQIVPMNDPRYKKIVNDLATFTGGKLNNEECWRGFSTVIDDFLQHLQDPTYSIHLYQIDLVNDIVISYLLSLKGRFHTDPLRVAQLTSIMTTILLSRTDRHPCNCLMSLERLQKEVNQGAYFFPSQLSSCMNAAISRQWDPIIIDNRNFLQNLGGKLLFFGLLGVIGWPLIFMYPMISHSQKLVKILNDFNVHHRISRQSIFELVQIVVMMLVCFQLTTIISMYTTFGYTAGIAGVGCLTVAQSNELIKQLSPTLATQAPVFDGLLTFLDSGDYRQILQQVSSQATSSQSPTDEASQFPSSSRVEEIPSDSAPVQEPPVVMATVVSEPEETQSSYQQNVRQRKKRD